MYPSLQRHRRSNANTEKIRHVMALCISTGPRVACRSWTHRGKASAACFTGEEKILQNNKTFHAVKKNSSLFSTQTPEKTASDSWDTHATFEPILTIRGSQLFERSWGDFFFLRRASPKQLVCKRAVIFFRRKLTSVFAYVCSTSPPLGLRIRNLERHFRVASAMLLCSKMFHSYVPRRNTEALVKILLRVFGHKLS